MPRKLPFTRFTVKIRTPSLLPKSRPAGSRGESSIIWEQCRSLRIGKASAVNISPTCPDRRLCLVGNMAGIFAPNPIRHLPPVAPRPTRPPRLSDAATERTAPPPPRRPESFEDSPGDNAHSIPHPGPADASPLPAVAATTACPQLTPVVRSARAARSSMQYSRAHITRLGDVPVNRSMLPGARRRPKQNP